MGGGGSGKVNSGWMWVGLGGVRVKWVEMNESGWRGGVEGKWVEVGGVG